MKKSRKLLTFLLAFALLAQLLPLQALAAGLTLTYRQTPQGDIVLGLTGLDGTKTIYGIELEVTLEGDYEAGQVDLSPKDPFAYSPSGMAATHQEGRSTVSLYLVSPYALNDRDALELGSLTADGMAIVPESARISLLDSDSLTGGAGATPLEAVTVEQVLDEGAPVFGNSFEITAPQAAHGKYRVLASARENQVVTIHTQPDTGYTLGSMVVMDAAGQRIPLLEKGNGQYSFRMPGLRVQLQAEFVPGSSGLPFTDVKENDWFYADVEYAYTHGMMNGMGAGLFSPSSTTNRAMIVTILYRLEGSPTTGTPIFTDVPQGQWYSSSVAWAAKNGIVDGYGNGKFGPLDVITREQMVSILHRYAAYKGYDTSAWADLSGFTDLGQVSSYAAPSMHWAVGLGLINGNTATTLAPKGGATRAQTAAILARFCRKTGA